MPRSKGGTRTVPLCEACHGKVHGCDLTTKALIIKAMQEKRARGEPLGGHIKYGYRLAADGKHVEENPEEQAAIADIKRLASDGKNGREISEELYLLGHKPRTGKIFASHTINDIRKRIDHSTRSGPKEPHQ